MRGKHFPRLGNQRAEVGGTYYKDRVSILEGSSERKGVLIHFQERVFALVQKMNIVSLPHAHHLVLLESFNDGVTGGVLDAHFNRDRGFVLKLDSERKLGLTKGGNKIGNPHDCERVSQRLPPPECSSVEVWSWG